MYVPTALISDYLAYYRKAKTIYSCHAPSTYYFARHVLESRSSVPLSRNIEACRRQLLKDQSEVQFVELGAGSATTVNNTTKTVAQIAKSSLSRKTQCLQLHHIVKSYSCKNVLEMGTSLGISTMYLAATASDTNIFTLEGDPTVAQIAQSNFTQLGLHNIDIQTGDFKDTLLPALQQMKTIDCAFVDGNHKYASTIAYFKEILPYTTEQSVLIFDDIYWSQEMKAAWQEIKHHEAVQLSIDLFHMGIVFLKKRGNPTHYRLIPWGYKPWHIGLWG